MELPAGQKFANSIHKNTEMWSAKTLKRLTSTIVDGEFKALGSNYSNKELALLKKATMRSKSSKVLGEVVYGGNNKVCCMAYRRFRCFAGHNAWRLIIAFLLINIPGLIFHAFVLPQVITWYESDNLLMIGLLL